MTRRKTTGYFERIEGEPDPLVARVERRVAFNEADVMGIAWHGRYVIYFEDCSTELRRKAGLSYERFLKDAVRAPIVQLHIDYHQPLFLDQEFEIRASLIWNEAARLNIEYSIGRVDGVISATGYTVQMFTDAVSGEACIVSPPMLEECRAKWKAGSFRCLQERL